MDFILSGASRGIGRALAITLAAGAAADDRLFLLARDAERLRALADELGPRAVPIVADLSRLSEARAVGERLAAEVRPGALLVHNAGVWPSRLELVDGFERAYATNCLAPLELQRPLLEGGHLARVLVISAGILVKGRFRTGETPTGRDFSSIKTYATTKLAGAIAMRDVARRHPEVDFAILHPGVVRTDLGARGGLIGLLLRAVKRGWEPPERCAERLMRILDRPRWRRPDGEVPWLVEESEQPWPAAVERDERVVLDALAHR